MNRTTGRIIATLSFALVLSTLVEPAFAEIQQSASKVTNSDVPAPVTPGGSTGSSTGGGSGGGTQNPTDGTPYSVQALGDKKMVSVNFSGVVGRTYTVKLTKAGGSKVLTASSTISKITLGGNDYIIGGSALFSDLDENVVWSPSVRAEASGSTAASAWVNGYGTILTPMAQSNLPTVSDFTVTASSGAATVTFTNAESANFPITQIVASSSKAGVAPVIVYQWGYKSQAIITGLVDAPYTITARGWRDYAGYGPTKTQLIATGAAPSVAPASFKATSISAGTTTLSWVAPKSVMTGYQLIIDRPGRATEVRNLGLVTSIKLTGQVSPVSYRLAAVNALGVGVAATVDLGASPVVRPSATLEANGKGGATLTISPGANSKATKFSVLATSTDVNTVPFSSVVSNTSPRSVWLPLSAGKKWRVEVRPLLVSGTKITVGFGSFTQFVDGGAAVNAPSEITLTENRDGTNSIWSTVSVPDNQTVSTVFQVFDSQGNEIPQTNNVIPAGEYGRMDKLAVGPMKAIFYTVTDQHLSVGVVKEFQGLPVASSLDNVSDVTVRMISATQMRVTWNPIDSNDDHRITMRVGTSPTPRVINVPAEGFSGSVVLDAIAPDTDYSISVSRFVRSVASSGTEIAKHSPPTFDTPAAPILKRHAASMEFNWTVPSSVATSLSGIDVLAYFEGMEIPHVIHLGKDARSYFERGATGGDWAIRYVFDDFESEPSQRVTASPLGTIEDVTITSSQALSPTTGKVVFTGNHPDGVVVYWGRFTYQTRCNYVTSDNSAVTAPTDTEYTLTGLTPGVEYCVLIKVRDVEGTKVNLSRGASYGFITPFTPWDPTGLQADQIHDGAVLVKWDNPDNTKWVINQQTRWDHTLDSYQLTLRAIAGDGFQLKEPDIVVAPQVTDTSAEIAVSKNTTYEVTLTSHGGFVDSQPARTRVIVQDDLPAPRNVNVTGAAGNAELSWKMSLSDLARVTEVQVRRGVVDGDNITYDDVQAYGGALRKVSVAASGSQIYQVRLVSGYHAGPWSQSVEFIRPPAPGVPSLSTTRSSILAPIDINIAPDASGGLVEQLIVQSRFSQAYDWATVKTVNSVDGVFAPSDMSFSDVGIGRSGYGRDYRLIAIGPGGTAATPDNNRATHFYGWVASFNQQPVIQSLSSAATSEVAPRTWRTDLNVFAMGSPKSVEVQRSIGNDQWQTIRVMPGSGFSGGGLVTDTAIGDLAPAYRARVIAMDDVAEPWYDLVPHVKPTLRARLVDDQGDAYIAIEVFGNDYSIRNITTQWNSSSYAMPHWASDGGHLTYTVPAWELLYYAGGHEATLNIAVHTNDPYGTGEPPGSWVTTSITTIVPQDVVKQVRNLSVTRSGSTITATWNGPAHGNGLVPTSFDVQTYRGGTWSQAGTVVGHQQDYGDTYSWTGVVPNGVTVGVTSKVSNGDNSSLSRRVTADIARWSPEAVANARADFGQGITRIRWEPPATGVPESYRVTNSRTETSVTVDAPRQWVDVAAQAGDAFAIVGLVDGVAGAEVQVNSNAVPLPTVTSSIENNLPRVTIGLAVGQSSASWRVDAIVGDRIVGSRTFSNQRQNLSLLWSDLQSLGINEGDEVSLKVYLLDSAGEPFAAATSTTLVGRPASPKFITPGADALISGDNVEVTGKSVAPNVVVSYGRGTDLITRTLAVTNGAWSTSFPVGPDGTSTVVAYAQGAAISGASPTSIPTSLNVRIDRGVPTPTISAPKIDANGADINVTKTPRFFGSASTDLGDLAGITLDVLQGTEKLQTTQAAVTGGNWSADLTNLTDGTYTLRITQKDDAGHVGTATRTVTYDTAPPIVSATATATRTTLALTGTAGSAESDVKSVVISGAGSDVTVAVDGNGRWSKTITLAAGLYNLKVTQKDLAENAFSFAVPEIVVGRVVPTVTVTSTVTKAGVVYSGTATTDPLVEATVTVKVGTVSKEAIVSKGKWTAAAIPLADGLWDATVVQKGIYGDLGQATTTLTLISTPPNLTVASPIAGVQTRATGIDVSGTAGIRLTDADSVAVVATRGTAESYTAVAHVNDDGTWATTVPLGAEGTWVITVTQGGYLDSQTKKQIANVIVDRTPPSVTFSACSPCRVPTFSVKGGTGLPTADVRNGINTFRVIAVAGASGTWQLPLDDGDVGATVYVSDAAGNQASIDSPLLQVDATVPTPTVDPPSRSADAVLWANTLSGTASMGVRDVRKVEVNVQNISAPTLTKTLFAAVGSDGKWSIPLNGMNGRWTVLNVKQADSIGVGTSDYQRSADKLLYRVVADDQPLAKPILIAPSQPEGDVTWAWRHNVAERPITMFLKVWNATDNTATATPVWSQQLTDTAGGSGSVPLNGLVEGRYKATLEVSDGVAVPVVSSQISWVRDFTTPSPTLTIQGADDGFVRAISGVTLSGTAGTLALDDTQVRIRFSSGTTLLTVPVAVVDGSWTLPLPTGVPEGVVTIDVQQRDAALRIGTSTPQVLTIQTAATLTSFAAKPSTTAGKIEISASGNAPTRGTITAVTWKNLTGSIINGSCAIASIVVANGKWTCSTLVNTTTFPNNTWTVSMTSSLPRLTNPICAVNADCFLAAPTLGTGAGPVNSFTSVINPSAPDPTITSPTASARVNPQFFLSGTTSKDTVSNSYAIVKLWRGPGATGDPAVSIQVDSPQGVWSTQGLMDSALPNGQSWVGTWTATVTQGDSQGRLGSSIPVTFIVDGTAPSAPTLTSSANTLLRGLRSADEGDLNAVTIKAWREGSDVSGSPDIRAAATMSTIFSATGGRPGWSYKLPSTGNWTIKLVQADQAGNITETAPIVLSSLTEPSAPTVTLSTGTSILHQGCIVPSTLETYECGPTVAYVDIRVTGMANARGTLISPDGTRENFNPNGVNFGWDAAGITTNGFHRFYISQGAPDTQVPISVTYQPDSPLESAVTKTLTVVRPKLNSPVVLSWGGWKYKDRAIDASKGTTIVGCAMLKAGHEWYSNKVKLFIEGTNTVVAEDNITYTSSNVKCFYLETGKMAPGQYQFVIKWDGGYEYGPFTYRLPWPMTFSKRPVDVNVTSADRQTSVNRETRVNLDVNMPNTIGDTYLGERKADGTFKLLRKVNGVVDTENPLATASINIPRDWNKAFGQASLAFTPTQSGRIDAVIRYVGTDAADDPVDRPISFAVESAPVSLTGTVANGMFGLDSAANLTVGNSGLSGTLSIEGVQGITNVSCSTICGGAIAIPGNKLRNQRGTFVAHFVSSVTNEDYSWNVDFYRSPLHPTVTISGLSSTIERDTYPQFTTTVVWPVGTPDDLKTGSIDIGSETAIPLYGDRIACPSDWAVYQCGTRSHLQTNLVTGAVTRAVGPGVVTPTFTSATPTTWAATTFVGSGNWSVYANYVPADANHDTTGANIAVGGVGTVALDYTVGSQTVNTDEYECEFQNNLGRDGACKNFIDPLIPSFSTVAPGNEVTIREGQAIVLRGAASIYRVNPNYDNYATMGAVVDFDEIPVMGEAAQVEFTREQETWNFYSGNGRSDSTTILSPQSRTWNRESAVRAWGRNDVNDYYGGPDCPQTQWCFQQVFQTFDYPDYTPIAAGNYTLRINRRNQNRDTTGSRLVESKYVDIVVEGWPATVGATVNREQGSNRVGIEVEPRWTGLPKRVGGHQDNGITVNIGLYRPGWSEAVTVADCTLDGVCLNAPSGTKAGTSAQHTLLVNADLSSLMGGLTSEQFFDGHTKIYVDVRSEWGDGSKENIPIGNDAINTGNTSLSIATRYTGGYPDDVDVSDIDDWKSFQLSFQELLESSGMSSSAAGILSSIVRWTLQVAIELIGSVGGRSQKAVATVGKKVMTTVLQKVGRALAAKMPTIASKSVSTLNMTTRVAKASALAAKSALIRPFRAFGTRIPVLSSKVASTVVKKPGLLSKAAMVTKSATGQVVIEAAKTDSLNCLKGDCYVVRGSLAIRELAINSDPTNAVDRALATMAGEINRPRQMAMDAVKAKFASEGVSDFQPSLNVGYGDMRSFRFTQFFVISASPTIPAGLTAEQKRAWHLRVTLLDAPSGNSLGGDAWLAECDLTGACSRLIDGTTVLVAGGNYTFTSMFPKSVSWAPQAAYVRVELLNAQNAVVSTQRSTVAFQGKGPYDPTEWSAATLKNCFPSSIYGDTYKRNLKWWNSENWRSPHKTRHDSSKWCFAYDGPEAALGTTDADRYYATENEEYWYRRANALP